MICCLRLATSVTGIWAPAGGGSNVRGDRECKTGDADGRAMHGTS
jgi:hypothetical protein